LAANADTFRLFLALWPNDQVRARLQGVSRDVVRNMGKPVPIQNLHITLAFLGYVDGATKACIEQAAGQVRQPPFQLVLDQVGYWPRPRVLWFGCAEAPDPMLTLVRDLQARFEACGCKPEKRPYHVHLTLARNVRHPRIDRQPDPVRWDVMDFALVESQTLPEGAVYRVLRSWPLQDQA
jgi:2'-5' RNA ligase